MLHKNGLTVFSILLSVLFFTTAYLKISSEVSDNLFKKNKPEVIKRIKEYHSILFDKREDLSLILTQFYNKELSLSDLSANQFTQKILGLFLHQDQMAKSITKQITKPKLEESLLRLDQLNLADPAPANQGVQFSHIVSVKNGSQNDAHIGIFAYRSRYITEITKRLNVDFIIIEREAPTGYKLIASSEQKGDPQELINAITNNSDLFKITPPLFAHKWLPEFEWKNPKGTTLVIPAVFNSMGNREQFILYTHSIAKTGSDRSAKYWIMGLFLLSLMITGTAYYFSPRSSTAK